MAEDPKNTEALIQNQDALEALENAEQGQKQEVYDDTDVDRKHEAARKAVDTHYEKKLTSFKGYEYDSGKFDGVNQMRRYDHQAEKLALQFSKKVDAVLSGEKNKDGAEKLFTEDLETRFVQESSGVEDAQYLHRILELDTQSVKTDLEDVASRGKVSMTRLKLYAGLNDEIKENIISRHQNFRDEQQNLRDRFEALQQPELDEYRELEGSWGIGKKGRRRRELQKTVGKKVEKVDKKFIKFEKFHDKFQEKLEKKFDDKRRKYEAGAQAAQYNVRIMGEKIRTKLNQFQNSPAEQQAFLEALQAFMKDKAKTEIFKLLGIAKPTEADQIHLLEVIMSEEFAETRREIEKKDKIEKEAEETTKKSTEALKDIQKAKTTILEKDLSLPSNLDELAKTLKIDRDTPRTVLKGIPLIKTIEKELFNQGTALENIYGVKDQESLGESTRMKGLLLFLFDSENANILDGLSIEIRGSLFEYTETNLQNISPLEEDHAQAKKIQKTVERLQSSDGVIAKAQRCMVMEGDPAKQQKALEEFLTAYNVVLPELDPFTNTNQSKEWTQFFRKKTGIEFDIITGAVKAIGKLATVLKDYKEGKIDDYFKQGKQREKELKVAETTVKQKESAYQEAARSDSANAASSNINISASGTQQTGDQPQQRTQDPAVAAALQELSKAQDNLADLQGKEDLQPPKVDQDWQQTYGATLSELRDFPFTEKFPVKNKKESDTDFPTLLNNHLNQEAQKELRNQFIERVSQANMFGSLTQMPQGKIVTLNITKTPDHKIDIPDTFTTASKTPIKAEVEFSESGTGISLVVKQGGAGTNNGSKIKVFAKIVEGKTVVENAVIIPPGAENDTSKRETAICTNFSLA